MSNFREWPQEDQQKKMSHFMKLYRGKAKAMLLGIEGIEDVMDRGLSDKQRDQLLLFREDVAEQEAERMADIEVFQ